MAVAEEVVTQEVKPEPLVTMTKADLTAFLDQAKADIKAEMHKELNDNLAQEEKAEAKAATPKKEFKLEREKFGMWLIKYEGGGLVPVVLQGVFTEEKIAKRAINSYLVERDKRENQNVESFAA